MTVTRNTPWRLSRPAEKNATDEVRAYSELARDFGLRQNVSQFEDLRNDIIPVDTVLGMVVGRRQRDQVFRIHAAGITACVVEVESIGNRSIELFEEQAMDSDAALRCGHSSVSGSFEESLPNPAPGICQSPAVKPPVTPFVVGTFSGTEAGGLAVMGFERPATPLAFEDVTPSRFTFAVPRIRARTTNALPAVRTTFEVIAVELRQGFLLAAGSAYSGSIGTRHSWTSYIGRGVRRAGDVPPSPGFSLPKLYNGGSHASH